MAGITNEAVEHYLYDLLPVRDDVLSEMEQQARERKIPIVGPAVGRMLFQLARMIGAKTVFEMGSAIGYSTIWWARAVGEGGKVIYTDGDRRNAEEARKYLKRAGVLERVEIRVGDALELLSEEKGTFDVVFNDVDKDDYPRVLRLVNPRVRKGGLFVTDNTLWSGEPAELAAGRTGNVIRMESTKAIVDFNRTLYASEEWFTTLMPLRDGVSVALRM